MVIEESIARAACASCLSLIRESAYQMCMSSFGCIYGGLLRRETEGPLAADLRAVPFPLLRLQVGPNWAWPFFRHGVWAAAPSFSSDVKMGVSQSRGASKGVFYMFSAEGHRKAL